MTNHDDGHEDDLVQYALGQLDAESTRALDRRAAADPAFAAEVEDVRRVLALLPAATATAPPPALRERVLAAARTEESAADAARPAARVPRPRRFGLVRYAWAPALAAAAALVAVVGLDNARLRRDLAIERQVSALLQQPNVVLGFAMKGEKGAAADAAFGSVLLDLDAKRGAVALERMPAPPEGRVYRLWAEVEGEAVYCGDLAFDEAGAVRALLPIPVESYTSPVAGLFVTLEPVEAPLVPSGPVLVRGAAAPAAG